MPPKPARVTKSKRGSDKKVPSSGFRRATRSQTELATSTAATTAPTIAAATTKSPSTSSSQTFSMPYKTIPEMATSTSYKAVANSTSSTSKQLSNAPSTRSSAAVSTSKPVYFWKPTEGNGYLGQWYPSKFTVEGDTYVTAEMWMMVQKARLFGDEGVAKQMLATTDPKRHKALGRKVKGFEEGVWDQHKLEIVEQGNYHKFTVSQDAENLRRMLLATGERELVEASPFDRIWGVGFAERNAVANRQKWGLNLLGQALMNVRDKLREEGKTVEGCLIWGIEHPGKDGGWAWD